MIDSVGSFARLDIEVDANGLMRDFRSLDDLRERPLRSYHAGRTAALQVAGWTAIPLRSLGGDATRTDPGGPGIECFKDTPLLSRMPAFAGLLKSLPCEVRSARLLALHPGSRVPAHRDDHIGFPFGQLRLHVPVQTNRRATITIDGTTTTWDPGGVWYGDFSQPHSASNDGDAARVHLVMDCLLSSQLLDAFPRDFRAAISPDDLLVNPPLEDGPLPWGTTSMALPATLARDLLAVPERGDGTEVMEVVASGHRLNVFHGRRPICGLERLSSGEWRMCGWTAERTFSFASDGTTLRIRRGVRTRTWILRSTTQER